MGLVSYILNNILNVQVVGSSRPTSQITNTLLGANAIYTQPWQNAQTLGVNYVSGSVYSDKAGTLYVDIADDQNNPILGWLSIAVTAGVPTRLQYPVFLGTNYFRFRYVNGTTAQTIFKVFQTTIPLLSPREVALTAGGVVVDQNNGLPISLTGSNIDLGTATTTGRQTAKPVATGSALRLNIWGTASAFAAQVQGQMYDGQWYTLHAANSITGLDVTGDITTAGIYDFDIGAFVQVALNMVSVTGGNINAKGAFLP